MLTRRHAHRWAAMLAVAAALLAASMASAKAAPGEVVFTTPTPWGVVDFGDPVSFKLGGGRCDGAKVVVEVEIPDGLVRGPAARGCSGHVRVPTLAAAAAAGYVEGQRLKAAVVSGGKEVALTFMRIQVDDAEVVAGTPRVIDSTDPRDAEHAGLQALEMQTGDAVRLGRAELGSIYSVSIRSAIPVENVDAALWELRADDPASGLLVAQGDLGHVGKSPANGGSYPERWYMLTFRAPPLLPAAGPLPDGVRDLYFRITASAGPVAVNWIDLNGTGARDPDVSRLTPDPAGTVTLFDGDSGFTGWSPVCSWTIADDEYELGNKAMRADHVSASANTLDARNCPAGPRAVYRGGGDLPAVSELLPNAVLRLRFRLEEFEDNGGIIVGGQEFQVHDRGEWFTGGYWKAGENCSDSVQFQTVLANNGLGPANSDCGYPADRIKGNTFPAWSEMEIIQNGRDYLVRVNGRDITRYQRHEVNLVSSFELSNFFGTSNTIGSITDWDHVWYDDIRIYRCAGPIDPSTKKSADPACATETLLVKAPSP